VEHTELVTEDNNINTEKDSDLREKTMQNFDSNYSKEMKCTETCNNFELSSERINEIKDIMKNINLKNPPVWFNSIPESEWSKLVHK